MIGQLNHAHAESEKQPQAVQLVFYGRGILKTEDDPGFALLFGGINIGRLFHLQDIIALAKAPHPRRQVRHRLQKIFPRCHRGIDSSDIASSQTPEHRVALPVADAQTVYYNRLVVDLSRIRNHQPIPPRPLNNPTPPHLEASHSAT